MTRYLKNRGNVKIIWIFKKKLLYTAHLRYIHAKYCKIDHKYLLKAVILNMEILSGILTYNKPFTVGGGWVFASAICDDAPCVIVHLPPTACLHIIHGKDDKQHQ